MLEGLLKIDQEDYFSQLMATGTDLVGAVTVKSMDDDRCPITYELCGTEKYSERGLKMIAPKLTHLNDLPFMAAELRREAVNRAKKLSIQGVQPKLSATISVVGREFKIVNQFGTYIIKPQIDLFPQLPENEDLTMRMAKEFGLDMPLHGMVYAKDGSLS